MRLLVKLCPLCVVRHPKIAPNISGLSFFGCRAASAPSLPAAFLRVCFIDILPSRTRLPRAVRVLFLRTGSRLVSGTPSPPSPTTQPAQATRRLSVSSSSWPVRSGLLVLVMLLHTGWQLCRHHFSSDAPPYLRGACLWEESLHGLTYIRQSGPPFRHYSLDQVSFPFYLWLSSFQLCSKWKIAAKTLSDTNYINVTQNHLNGHKRKKMFCLISCLKRFFVVVIRWFVLYL